MNDKGLIEAFRTIIENTEYDGLYCDAVPCGCVLDDHMGIAPCECLDTPGDIKQCKLGYRHPGDIDAPFYVRPYKYEEKKQ